jgi:GntR family transcriptional regulator
MASMMLAITPAKPAKKARKYQAVRDWLVDRIAQGEYGRGAQLPSEHDLMARFEVSRVTARQALDDLRRLGIVESRRGKGHFVSRLTAVHSLQRLQSFGEMMAPLGVATHSNVIELLETPATKEVAAALRIAAATPVTRIVRTRLAAGTVVSLDVSFFPVDVGRALTGLDLAKEDIFLLLERRLGIELGYADITIDVVPAEERHAKHIGASKGEPVIRIRRVTHDNDGRPIDCERIYARLDALAFRVRVPRG